MANPTPRVRMPATAKKDDKAKTQTFPLADSKEVIDRIYKPGG